MAAITSTTSGNWVDGSTWVGGVAPGDGDTAVIATGHTVTCTTDVTIGANGSNVGIGITINATNSSVFGKLIVNSGVTLTLKGNDTTNNAAMRILRYGMFQPNPGSIILCDCASDRQTVIRNEGHISAIGTSGSHITFGIPSANYTFNNTIAAEAKSSNDYKYDDINGIACFALTNCWISNAAGDGPGSLGDSSFAKTATPSSPTTILVTEVASIALVNGTGKYYINYDLGLVFFYHNATTSITAEVTYKYATVAKGWSINSITDQDDSQALFDYCDFSHMAGSASDLHVLDLRYKYTAAAATAASKTNRLAYVKHCTFTRCHSPIGLKDCTGTAADKFLITNNTFNAESAASNAVIWIFRTSNAHVKIDSNTFISQTCIGVSVFTTARIQDSFAFTNNTVTMKLGVISGVMGCTWPDLDMSSNSIYGCGSAADSRVVTQVLGTSGHHAVFADNLMYRCKRSIHWSSYNTIERNLVYESYHHGMPASGTPDTLFTSIRIRNNLFYGEVPVASEGYDGSPSIELGYWDGQHLDDIQIVNNTFCGNPSGAVGFGDTQDSLQWTTLSRIVVANNLCVMNLSTSSKVWQRRANSASDIIRMHLTLFDYNLDYNYATRYTNITRQGMFVKSGVNYNDDSLVTRNIDGVALYDPNFSTKTGGTLDFTYTSDTDMTLAWDGGTAIQLVLASGTAEASTQVSTSGISGLLSSTFTDNEASWTDTKNDAACPVGHWVKITGGTGAGQIRVVVRRNSATQLVVVPAWTTPLSTDSTYSIIMAQVTLDDGADTVKAGIYLPDLPVTSQNDTGIDFADHSVTGSDPLLVSTVSSNDGIGTPGPATDYYPSLVSSPAIGAGTAVYGATLDYVGTTRDGSPDIGFYEWVAAAAAAGAGPGTYLRWTAGMLNNRVPPHYRR